MQGHEVSGWALSASGRGHCVITVTDEAGLVVAKGRAGLARADLAALGLGRDDLAFRLALPECVSRRIFRVFANGMELPGSPLEAGPGRYDGDCMIDGGVLKGWVRERIPGLSEPSISIVTQHGVIVGQGQSALVPRSAPARAGFEIALGDDCFGVGELRLAVLADGERFTEIGCELPLQGSTDLLTPEACSGWLLAPDAPRRKLEIEIFRDGVSVALARCGTRRPDVGELYPGSAAGFAASFPWKEAGEAKTARISLRLRGGTAELFGGPFIVGGGTAMVLAAQRAASKVQGLAAQGLATPGLDLGAAERAVIGQALQEFIRAARGGKGDAAPLPAALAAAPLPERLAAAPQAEPAQNRLCIVIPVYGNVAATRLCIDSVLAHRIAPLDRVVLINDASPEPGMAELLEQYRPQPNLYVLRNPQNLGFVKTVNRGFGFAGDADVLLLNADTILYPGGLDELARIARSAPEIGTVTALSNDATIFSYPGPHPRRAPLADCGWAELAEAALAGNAGLALDVPTGHGFCMLIKAGLLRRLGGFDESFGRGYGEENEFCARAADLGYRHVAAAGVFVQHGGSLSFREERDALIAQNLPRLARRHPEYFPALAVFERARGLRAAGWALDRWRLACARREGASFALVICNSLGGGSAKAVADFEQAVGYGGAVRLSLTCLEDGGMSLSSDAPLFRAHFAAGEIGPLFQLLDAAAPGLVLAHQLLGFSAGFLRRLGDWAAGRPAIYYAHDFYALCPRVTFIDAAGDFCDLAETPVCERCLAIAGAHEDSRLDLAAAAHRDLFAVLLRGFTQVVAPSASAALYLRRGLPQLPVRVIAHPETDILPAGRAARLLEQENPPIRRAEDAEEIVLFGAIGPHKGAGKLLETARRARLTHPGLSFRVIGHTSLDAELLAAGNVRITGRYDAQTLPLLVAEARGNLALFLHEWPETYSYTLSEALSFGFVPLVPDIGAPAERVRAMGFGVIYPFPSSAAAILQCITDVLSGHLPRFAPGARPEEFHPGPAAVEQARELLDSRRESGRAKNQAKAR